MKAYVFPGQGAQFAGMGKEMYNQFSTAKALFDKANDILGFNITDIMFNGSDEDLKQTKVTQPAVFLYSVILAEILNDFAPDMVAGHSLGEVSALVANKTLSFEDGLKLVAIRAQAMQKACEAQPSTMAAIIGLDDATIENICQSFTDEIVVPANYNSPGQLVISGTTKGIEEACVKIKEAGAKRALPLNVSGAFHSPLMNPAKLEFEKAIDSIPFNQPICPIYQNATAKPCSDPIEIKKYLIDQLTSPVLWTQTIKNMSNDGALTFIEVGPGQVLQGLVKKIIPGVETFSAKVSE